MLHRFLCERFSTRRLHISRRSVGFKFQTRFLCPFILVNIAEEEVARLVAGHDSGAHIACFAGDEKPRACPVPVGDDAELDRFCLVRLPS